MVSLYLFFLDAENSGDCPGLLLTLVANILTSFPFPQSFSEQSAGHSPHPVPRPRAHSRTRAWRTPGEGFDPTHTAVSATRPSVRLTVDQVALQLHSGSHTSCPLPQVLAVSGPALTVTNGCGPAPPLSH